MEIAESQSREEDFIQKLTQIVLDNLTNEQFSVEELAVIYGISRSQLHKKLKKATRKSVSQFIREIRLEEAMKMLREDTATVSEVAYQVGFSSPTYFNTCFKEFYGYPPGEVKFRKHSEIEKGEKIQTSEKENLSYDINETIQLEKKPTKQRILLLSSVGLVIILAISYFFYKGSSENNLSEAIETEILDKSIAVIPFENWSGDPELEYVSDGMTDAVITRLAKIQSIEKVIPFTSMLKYKETDKNIPQIATELGVQNILQGNFQLSGNQVKINLQLIDGPSNNHFWSDDYTGEWNTNDIFKIQAEVAENVAKNMQAEITDIEIEAIQKFPTQNKEAYDLYLKAEYLKSRNDAYAFEKAISLYESAIAMDANFAEAYIGLANTHILGGFFWGVFDEQEAWKKAKPLLQRALEIDNTNIQAHRDLFAGYFYYEWNFDVAEAYYQGKLPENGLNSGWKRHAANYYAIKTGRSDEALSAIERNIADDPSDRLQYLQKADALFFLGDRVACSNTLEFYNSYFTDNFYYLTETARLYYYLEEHEKAKNQLQLLMDKFPGRPPIVLWLDAVCQDIDGNQEGVKELLNVLHEKHEEEASGSPAWFLALYYSHIKDYEKTLEWLQKSYDRHEVEMTWLREEPLLKPVCQDPRYLGLYKNVGFPVPPPTITPEESLK